MASNYTEYSLQLINSRTGKPLDDDTGIVNVLTADDPSEVTLYSNMQGTSQANPLTMTDGRPRFFTAATVTSVDLSIQTAGGRYFFLEDVTPSHHRLLVDPERSDYTAVLPFQVVGASETVVDTGFTLPGNVLVREVFLHVTTLGTGAALDIGTSTDTDGFLDGADGATTGFAPIAQTDASAHIMGALIASTTSEGIRKLYRQANATSGASVVYINTTSSSTAGEGYIYLTVLRVPTGA